MKYTLVFAALLGVQAIQLADPGQVSVDRFDSLCDADMSAEIKQEAAESKVNAQNQKKDDWMKDYNQFDGLVHKGGKLYELDGTAVQSRIDSFVQLNE